MIIYIREAQYLEYIYFLRKPQNILFPEKKWRFLTLDDRKRLKTSSKERNLAYCSHGFISISNFLTKTDFFLRGGGMALSRNEESIMTSELLKT